MEIALVGRSKIHASRWTYRNIQWDRYAANKNYPEEKIEPGTSRKLNADIFIDDRNVGGFVGWSDVWQTIHPEGGAFSHQLKNQEAHHNYKKTETSIFKKIFGPK